MLRRLGRAIHANEFAGQVSGNRGVDPERLSGEVRICRAKYKTRMLEVAGIVDFQKVPPVLSQQGPFLRTGEGENIFIGNPSVGLSRFQRSEDVVP